MIKEIQVVSYNVQNGLYSEEIVSNIRRIGSTRKTIFCLQEIRSATGRKFIADTLTDTLSGDGWKGEYFLGSGNLEVDLGLGILYQPDNSYLMETERILLPKITGFNLFEILWTPGGRPAQRGALVTTFGLGDKTIRVTNLHLDWQGGFSQRARQLSYIASYLKKMPIVDGEIVCGDFNTKYSSTSRLYVCKRTCIHSSESGESKRFRPLSSGCIYSCIISFFRNNLWYDLKVKNIY